MGLFKNLKDFEMSEQERGYLKILKGFWNIRAISKMLQAFSNRRDLKISERQRGYLKISQIFKSPNDFKFLIEILNLRTILNTKSI